MVRVVLLLTAFLAAALARPEDKYTTKYDNANLDSMLRNDRLLNRAFNCLMDKGSCTNEMMELKKALPDALRHGCSKCSDKQKSGARKVLKFLYEHKKEHFNNLEKKYDPEGTYRRQYKDLAAKEGYKI